MCFGRFITILLQKSLKLSAMILGSLVLTLQMLETEYSGFGDQYHACWCPGSSSHQGISRHGIDSIGYATCGVAPLVIWSSVEQNLTYDTKCEYIFIISKQFRVNIVIPYNRLYAVYFIFFFPSSKWFNLFSPKFPDVVIGAFVQLNSTQRCLLQQNHSHT